MSLSKTIRYKTEAVLLYVLFGFFKVLPLDTASATGGWIGKTIGPKLSASRKAKRNLQMALPDKTENMYNDIIAGMWENLGRVIAEYPHLKKIALERVETEGLEQFTGPQKRPIIFIAAHLANWEVMAPTLFFQHGIQGLLVYRAPNNPAADKLLAKSRQLHPDIRFTTKSDKGVREMVRELKNNGVLGLLIDQKFNKGYAVPFFHQPAMTGSAFVELAQKFDAHVIPLHIERVQGANFRLSVAPELIVKDKKVEDALRESHILLEEWIKKRPEQWLWLHKRWGVQNINKETIH